MRYSVSRVSWLLTGVFALTGILLARPALSQFTPFAHGPHTILEGSWQSCRGPDARYSERVYDHVVNGVGKFEVHLGPHREFAIFKGVQDEHRLHDSPENLLKPYRVELDGARAKHRWEIRSLNLAFSATLAGGSRMDCESWHVILEPLEKTSH